MPRAATSESEGEPVTTGSTKKTYASKKRRATSVSESDVEEVTKEANEEPEETAAEVEGEEEGEGEEEYEIEKILDAKKGQFSGVRFLLFVMSHNHRPYACFPCQGPYGVFRQMEGLRGGA